MLLKKKIEFYIIDYLKLLQEFYNVTAKNLSPLIHIAVVVVRDEFVLVPKIRFASRFMQSMWSYLHIQRVSILDTIGNHKCNFFLECPCQKPDNYVYSNTYCCCSCKRWKLPGPKNSLCITIPNYFHSNFGHSE